MRRQLVVNADDLGLTVRVNDGIFDAHERGILTSASLMANAPATVDAIRRSRSHPTLGIGAHLTLLDGSPTLPPDQVPTLVTDDGRFPRSWRSFIVACLRGRVSLLEVERELTAQIRRLQKAGVELTHLDSHQHVHGYPPLFAIVAKLAAECAIPVVRVPYERSVRSSLFDTGTDAPCARPDQVFLNGLMRPWAIRNRRIAGSFGLRTPALIGRIDAGILSRRSLHSLLRNAAAGVSELMVHPGDHDEALAGTGTRRLGSRQEELALLCSLETRAVLMAEHIELVRHDLAHSRRRDRRMYAVADPTGWRVTATWRGPHPVAVPVRSGATP
jgi:chitin disaccharide deacetylase